MGKNKDKIDSFVSVATAIDQVNDTTKKFFTGTLSLLQKRYTNYELIIVANGLPDDLVEDVAELLKEYPCIRIIRLSRKYNHEVATFAAIESAIGDYVIVASAVSDPPSAIPHMVDILRDHHDIVFGVSKKPIPYPFLAKLGRKWFFWYSGHFLEVNIPVNTTYLMGMNRRAINALTQIKGHHRHIRHISAQVGFKTATYEYLPKFNHGLVNRGFIKNANLALEIAISYSHHPLRLLSKVSLLISLVNVVVATYTVATYVARNGNVAEGWTTLTLEMSVMFFFVFLMLAVIAEYIGQIREELRDQPPYHIMEELTSNVLIADETRRNIAKK